MIGSLSGGRLVIRFGRKSIAVFSTFVLGLLALLYFNIGLFWFAVPAMLLSCGISSMRYTVSESLVLEQVPDLRGTVMSFNSIALGLGSAIGASLGGYILLVSGYSGLSMLGILGFLASVIYRFYAVDPTIQPHTSND
jgi:predicted MFS family arabinose efflux permease